MYFVDVRFALIKLVGTPVWIRISNLPTQPIRPTPTTQRLHVYEKKLNPYKPTFFLASRECIAQGGLLYYETSV